MKWFCISWVVLIVGYMIAAYWWAARAEKRINDQIKRCMDDLAEGRKNLDRRTADAIKQHKEALQSLYEYAQRACEIRSNMLQKITDLERCAQAHEAWIEEQEEEQMLAQKQPDLYERRE